MPTFRIIVKGKVQGVFYRACAKETADENGVKGWVRNLESGEVEIMATGSKGQLASFIDWCKQGPPRAIVTHVDIAEKEEMAFDEFMILRRG